MKVIKWLSLIALIGGVAAAMWYFRPWSEYSPAKIASLSDPSKFAHDFQNMDEFIPYRTVRRGETVRRFTEQAEPLDLNYFWSNETKALDQFLQETAASSLLVVKDGVIRHEQYRLESNRETLFTSWSVAKSFVATAIFVAQKEGLIKSLDDPAEKYAPQFKGSDFGASSLRSLLTMSSGIEFNEDYVSDDSDVRPFFFNSFILGKDPDALLLPFKRSRKEFTDFQYISPNSHVLSAVLRGVYDKPLAEIITEKVWQPLGMEADATWSQHRVGDKGRALGYCCLNARTRDYARFGQFYLETSLGRETAPDLLPDGRAQTLSQPATDVHKTGGEAYAGRGYSYHFWLVPDQPGVFIAAGVYGQYIWIDPVRNVVIVKTSADPEFITRHKESFAVFEAIANHYQ